MQDVQGGRVLYERKHDGTCGIGTEKGYAFGEAITADIGLGGGERRSIDFCHRISRKKTKEVCDQPVATNCQLGERRQARRG